MKFLILRSKGAKEQRSKGAKEQRSKIKDTIDAVDAVDAVDTVGTVVFVGVIFSFLAAN